jgi:hypothetical protein
MSPPCTVCHVERPPETVLHAVFQAVALHQTGKAANTSRARMFSSTVRTTASRTICMASRLP